MKFSGVLTSEHYKVCLHTWLFTWVYRTQRCVVHHWILEKKRKKTQQLTNNPQNDAIYRIYQAMRSNHL